MLECKMQRVTPETVAARRRQLLTYARTTGNVTRSMLLAAWEVELDADTLFAAAGMGVAEYQISLGNTHVSLEKLTENDDVKFPQSFIDGFNAGMQLGKIQQKGWL